MTAYTPPGQRLIIRSEEDFETLGTTAAAVKAAADQSFWAYKDFDSVLASFALAPSDSERRVMGIEGVDSGARLQEIIASGKADLKIGRK